MKSFTLLSLAILIFCSCQPKVEAPITLKAPISLEAPITLAEKQIAMDLIKGSFDDLWGGADSTKILDYHTKDFIILENGEVWDNDRIKQFMRRQLAQPERATRLNRMEFISIDKYGQSMQIVYNNHADFMRADTLAFQGNWLESALAVPTADGWRLKMMHSTWIKDKE